jgi:hypothetical protein
MSDRIDIEAFERWVFSGSGEGPQLGPFRLLEILNEGEPDDETKRRLLEICSYAKRVEGAKLSSDPDGRGGSFKLKAIIEIEAKLKSKRQ